MSPLDFCKWLADQPASIALHESILGYPIVEGTHLLTICLFVGLTLMMDLRLLGLTFRATPMSQVTSRLLPWIFGGFVVLVITGLALFYAAPIKSYINPFFRVKVIFLIVAGLNALLFHKGIEQSIKDWDLAPVPPFKARLAGAVSIFSWIVVIICGRLIAYNWFDPIV